MSDQVMQMLRKHLLPTRTRLSKHTITTISNLSNKEIEELNNRERAKLMLVRAKRRQLEGDLKKKLNLITKKTESIKKKKMHLEYSAKNKTKQKKYALLLEQEKKLTEKKARDKTEAAKAINHINRKSSSIEQILNTIDQEQLRRTMKK